MYQFKHIELCYSSINNLRSVSLIKEYSGFFFVLQAAVGADVVGERPAARTQPNPTISFPPRPLFFRRGLIVSNATRHDATRRDARKSQKQQQRRSNQAYLHQNLLPPPLSSPLHPPVTRAPPPPHAAAAAGSSIPPGRLPAVSCREVSVWFRLVCFLRSRASFLVSNPIRSLCSSLLGCGDRDSELA